MDAEVRVPPSKSYTNRALIASALAEGTSMLLGPSSSDDSAVLIDAICSFGIAVRRKGECLEIEGSDGVPRSPLKEVFVGNAGTAMRFLSTFAALAKGDTVLNGDERMRQRPIDDLLSALRAAGVKCSSEGGFPPVKIQGGLFRGGLISIDSTKSSQFVSSLLLSSPYAQRTVSLHVSGKLRSLPYVDMTLHVMRAFGAEVDVIDP